MKRIIGIFNSGISTWEVRQFNIYFSAISRARYLLHTAVVHVSQLETKIVISTQPNFTNCWELLKDSATQLHLIVSNLNDRRCVEEILNSIVVLCIRRHQLTSQQDNSLPRVARICPEYLASENVPSQYLLIHQTELLLSYSVLFWTNA